MNANIGWSKLSLIRLNSLTNRLDRHFSVHCDVLTMFFSCMQSSHNISQYFTISHAYFRPFVNAIRHRPSAISCDSRQFSIKSQISDEYGVLNRNLNRILKLVFFLARVTWNRRELHSGTS